MIWMCIYKYVSCPSTGRRCDATPRRLAALVRPYPSADPCFVCALPRALRDRGIRRAH